MTFGQHFLAKRLKKTKKTQILLKNSSSLKPPRQLSRSRASHSATPKG
eukprot:COSAG01_NODE_66825_length_269_cov_0.323529_1_plen_47_part_01